MKHTLTMHCPLGRAMLSDHEDINKIGLLTDVHETELPDGSSFIVCKTTDAMLRFRLTEEAPGVTVFPHHFSQLKLETAHVDLLAHAGVDETDTMETALLKMSQHHGHYRCHPHAF